MIWRYYYDHDEWYDDIITMIEDDMMIFITMITGGMMKLIIY